MRDRHEGGKNMSATVLHIRLAEPGDLAAIMGVYHVAQELMIRTGNASQWGRSYPSEELVLSDIQQGACHVITDEAGRVCAVFALFFGEEASYRIIDDGAWLNDAPYATVHRIASDGSGHGIFRTAIEFCKARVDNIRIDTHRDNTIMQSLIEGNGLVRCGIINVANGTERIA